MLLPAQLGNASAQYELGLMYHEGKGVPEDNTASLGWTRKSAEQGNAAAEVLLGILYSRGQGVSRDDAEAARWFHKAAAQGHASGQMKMGMCCLLGVGIPQDHLKAYMWFDLAAAHPTGHDQLCDRNLRDTHAAMNLTPTQMEEARRIAREWKPQRTPFWKRFRRLRLA